MKTVKRMVCMLLAVVMLAGLCTGFAAPAQKQFKYYVSLGDSVASGYTVDWNSYYKHGYENYVPEAYPNLVRNALKIPEMYQGAIHGIRTTDARILLENDFDGDAFTTDFLPGHGPWRLDQLKALRTEYQEQVKKADLITLNVVNNDMLGNMAFAMRQMYARRSNDPVLTQKVLNEAIARAKEAGTLGAACEVLFKALLSLDETLEEKTTQLEFATKSVAMFKESWDKLCEDIYKLNPDVTLVAVCMYCPPATTNDYGEIARLFLDEINRYMKSGSPYSNRYVFADVSDITAINTNDYDTYGGGDLAHPDIYGHQQMAAVIVKAVNDYKFGRVFTDVRESSKHYDNIYDMYHQNVMFGVTGSLFMPAALLTREQAAVALYRLAGSPDAAGYDRDFIDVKADDPAYRAIVWATGSGVMKSVTSRLFMPDATVSRAQLADMLYRISGQDAVDAGYTRLTDSPFIPSRYYESVQWAVEKTIISRCADGGFHSYAGISRGNAAGVFAAYTKL